MKLTKNEKRTKISVEEATEILRNSDFNGAFLGKNIRNTITEEIVELISNAIINRIPLININESLGYSNQKFSVLLNNLLPLLFEESDIQEYFLELLKEKYGNVDTWTYPRQEASFTEFTGLVLSVTKKSRPSFWLGHQFNHVYTNIFMNRFYYPQTFIDDAVQLIRTNQPLSSNYDTYKEKYQSGKDNRYLVFIGKMVLPIIGIDMFDTYMKNIVKKYMSDLPFDSVVYRTNDHIQKYIFGHSFSYANRLNAHNHNSDDGFDYIGEMYRLILNATFPIVLPSYRSKAQRNPIYKMLGYTEEQIAYYEKEFLKYDRRESYLPIDESSTALDVLPFGTTKKELYSAIHDYFDNIRATTRVCPSKRQAINELSSIHGKTNLGMDIRKCYKTSSLRSILSVKVDEEINLTKAFWYSENDNQFDSDTDLLDIYFKGNETYYRVRYDLSNLTSSFLKSEFKLYIRNNLTESKTKMPNIQRAIDAIAYIENKYGIEKACDVKEWHILEFLHHKEIDDKIKPNSLKVYLVEISRFYRYLIKQDYLNHPIISPTINIVLHNAEDHTDNTPIIPDEILDFLDEHINEIPNEGYRLMYHILMETGWRFGDLRELKSNAITPLKDDPTLAHIEVSSPKTKKARIKNRLGDKLEDVISKYIYDDAIHYINHTQYVREKYGIETLFFSIANNVIVEMRSGPFNIAINRLLKRYGMQTISDDYWNITTRQTRKTVAATMISNGASLAAVQQKLGHVSDDTTERYYAEVRKMKISELNTEFFKKKFGVYMDEDKLERFTLQERRTLYVNFCMSTRDVGLGKCIKHPTDGPCAEMGDFDCGDCSKLCVGKKYLPEWEKRAKQAKERLDEYIALYEKYDIPFEEYSLYLDYKWEKKRYDKAIAVVNKINNN